MLGIQQWHARAPDPVRIQNEASELSLWLGKLGFVGVDGNLTAVYPAKQLARQLNVFLVQYGSKNSDRPIFLAVTSCGSLA